MIDLVASVFRLTNARYLMVPKLDFAYEEKGTGVRWHISAGASRAYALRFGKGLASAHADSIDKQNADSHFMVNRVQYALLLGGHGLFQAEAVGRIFVPTVDETADWFSQMDFPTSKPESASDSLYDWLKALISHTMLRRAAADAHAALTDPHEAGTYVYRGLEWLVVGEGRGWDDLAPDLGMSQAQVRDFKKMANVDYGVRHASRSGAKLRADAARCGVWVCALVDAINATRSRLDPSYKIATPEQVADAILRAMPADPYA